MSCNWTPPLVEQLHGPDPTAGSDCAIAVAKMAIRFATCGKLDPGMDQIRKQAGLDKPDPPPSDYSTTMSEYTKACNKWDDEAQRAGYEGITANAVERGRWTDLEPILKAEAKWTCLYVNYGVLNDREPGKSGDKNFRGAHAIGVYGYTPASQTNDGTHKYRVFDPLCDGRKPDIPKGPTYWKAGTLRDAADAYAGGGSGTATWCITPRSKVLNPPPTEPPPDPCATSMAVDRGALLQVAYEFVRESDHANAKRLARWIRSLQGDNPGGLALPVHAGVTPDTE